MRRLRKTVLMFGSSLFLSAALHAQDVFKPLSVDPGQTVPGFYLINMQALTNALNTINNTLLAGSSIWVYVNPNDIANYNSGNVGIGTTNPGTKLDVSGGTVSARGLKLELNKGGGIVFSDQSRMDTSSLTVASKSGSYTAVFTDDTLLVNASAAAVTITLPAASARTRQLFIKKIDSTFNQVKISTGLSSDAIEASSQTTLNTLNELLILTSTGTGWKTTRIIPSIINSYAPTLKGTISDPGLGSTGVSSATWRRVGDSMEVKFKVLSGGAGIAAGSGNYYLTLPAGLLIDFGKIPVDANILYSQAGTGTVNAASVVLGRFSVITDGSTNAVFFWQDSGGTGGGSQIANAAPTPSWFTTAGNGLAGFFTVPIKGWNP